MIKEIDIMDFTDSLPLNCVEDCTQSGSNDEAVGAWTQAIKCPFTDKQMVEFVEESGAWGDEEINAMTRDELYEKTFWLCAWNAKEYDNEAYDQ